jgi:hypothetical protein
VTAVMTVLTAGMWLVSVAGWAWWMGWHTITGGWA